MLTSFCCFRKCFQWYLGLSVTSCCLFLLFICSLLPVGPGTMLCPSLLQEAGPVPSTECGFKPSSTFSFPHFPSLEGPSCVSHLQAGGSRFLRHCLGADSLLGAEGPWAPLSAHDAAASLGGSVLWCVGTMFCSGRYCWLLSIRFGSWTDCQGICHCLSPVQESQQDF